MTVIKVSEASNIIARVIVRVTRYVFQQTKIRKRRDFIEFNFIINADVDTTSSCAIFNCVQCSLRGR